MEEKAHATKEHSLANIVAFAKSYGFIYPSSEIYDRLQAVYDYGPYGALLKQNVKNLWWKSMTQLYPDIVGLDAAIFMHPKTWEASGHTSGFNDLMVDNKDSKKRYRVDVLIEDYAHTLSKEGKTKAAQQVLALMNALIAKNDFLGLKNLLIDENIACPESNTAHWADVRKFNLMFTTQVGAIEEDTQTLYLRPETAQGIFVNFLNVQKTTGAKVPFGIAQIGKAFRNELIARQFTFRMREFEQMEMQFFIAPGDEKEWFEHWKTTRLHWHEAIGISKEKLHIHAHEQLAHYADAAVDIEYDFPFGRKEVEGIHSRTDFDLKQHQAFSKKKLQYFDPRLNESYIPYVIETSVGCDRLILMLLCEALTHSIDEHGKERTLLKLHPALAPIKAAILPLLKKDGLPEKAKAIFNILKYDFSLNYEETQSIGKRYAKQDLIGTPYCITVDHQTLEDNTVTIRERDTMQQSRLTVDGLKSFLEMKVSDKTILSKLV